MVYCLTSWRFWREVKLLLVRLELTGSYHSLNTLAKFFATLEIRAAGIMLPGNGSATYRLPTGVSDFGSKTWPSNTARPLASVPTCVLVIRRLRLPCHISGCG